MLLWCTLQTRKAKQMQKVVNLIHHFFIVFTIFLGKVYLCFAADKKCMVTT